MTEPNQILALTPAEFSAITGLPKYSINRNMDKFEWFDWAKSAYQLPDELKARIKKRVLLTDQNIQTASQLLNK